MAERQSAFGPKKVMSRVRQSQPSHSRESFDPGQFLVDTCGTHTERYPSVAFDGTNYLVVWTDGRSVSNTDIYGVRVDSDGVVLDAASFMVSAAVGDQVWPVVAFDGSDYFVVWEDYRGSIPDIYGVRVSPAGAVLDTSGIAISAAAGNQSDPALASDGTNYLVVWQDKRSGSYDIYGARVSPGGTVLDPTGIPISAAANDQLHPGVAFDGTNYFVVWQDGRSDPYVPDICGARVSQAGAVLDQTGICLFTGWSSRYPSVSFDGTNYLVAFIRYTSRYSQVAGARVNPAGLVLGNMGIGSLWWSESPAACFDGTNHLVVWSDTRPGTYAIYGAQVNRSGSVSGEFLLVNQEGNQSVPALSRGLGSQLFLVYQGWVGEASGKTYNTDRILGQMDPRVGIEETMNDGRGTPILGPSIVRGVLRTGDSRQKTGYRGELLDAAGRKVADLQPGDNDVSGLAPGVYFVREAQAQAQAQAVWKVIVTR